MSSLRGPFFHHLEFPNIEAIIRNLLLYDELGSSEAVLQTLPLPAIAFEEYDLC